jgi:hypothetical protein
MRSFLVCASAILGLLLAPAAAPAAASECTATIDGTLMRKEGKETETVYTAKIDVSVPAPCAVVRFDVVVVEEASGGERTEVRVAKKVKLRGSSPTSLKLDYKLKHGQSIVEHRFEQRSCEICE